MTTVAIIGGGSFGTALACVARRAGLAVKLWAREPEVAAAINAGHGNPIFLPGVPVEPGIQASSDLREVAAAGDFVLMAVPSQFLRAIAGEMRGPLPRGTAVVSCSKGIELESCALMPEVIADVLPEARIAVLAGPSFAKEVAIGQTTGVTVASKELQLALWLSKTISSAHFRAYACDDPISATIGGAFKNVLAIACGIAIARQMGENVRGLLVARGLYEMAQLARAKGANPVNLLGLAGCGDVTLTCMGTQSRNTTFGIALGEGHSAAGILAERKVVTEGVKTAEAITELGRRLGVAVPIAAGVDAIIKRRVTIHETFSALFSQPADIELAGVAAALNGAEPVRLETQP